METMLIQKRRKSGLCAVMPLYRFDYMMTGKMYNKLMFWVASREKEIEMG